MRRLIAATFAATCLAVPGWAQDLPVIRAAVLQIGTVNWELSTIVDNGLDEKHGFELEVQPYADNGATRVAVEGGEADMAVADWIWVARQRAAGKEYVYIPYSKAVGALLVPEDSEAESLQDLAGGDIGIAGGPLDKSWLILRAYATREHEFDLAAETEQVFGAPPLIFKSGLSGEIDGAINYWHFLAKMKAGGMRELVNVEEAAVALGLDPDTPLLGYYMKEDFLSEHEDIAQKFYDASQEAKALLRDNPDEWDKLRPQMNASTDAEFEALKTDWIAGAPERGPIDLDSMDAFLQVMNDLGGQELVGQATTLPDGLFADVE